MFKKVKDFLQKTFILPVDMKLDDEYKGFYCDEYGIGCNGVTIISKEIFIEAFEKYIKK